MFTKSDFIVQGMNGLIEAFKSGFGIEGEVLEEARDELKEYLVDSYYENFLESSRDGINLHLIYQFEPNGKFYSICCFVGLTEYQDNYFYSQFPVEVFKDKIVIEVWTEKRIKD